MLVRETKIGGLFTLLLFAVVSYVVISNFLYFNYDNVTETKAQIPIVVVEENYGVIDGKITINVIFQQYGGECITEENT